MKDLLPGGEFEKQIRNSPATGYLLFGEEDYLKQHAVSVARSVLCPEPEFAAFNDIKVDALEFSPDVLLDSIMAYPMMADRKLITLTGLQPSAMSSSELSQLCEVLQALEEYDYNTLLLVVASDGLDPGYLPKRPSPVLSKLGETLVPVRFEKNTPAKLAAWVGRHFTHYGVSASGALCQKLIDYCGTGMYILASEIEKLCYYILSQGRKEAAEADIEAVAVAVPEYDSFALTNALLQQKPDEALQVLQKLKSSRTDPVIIMAEIDRCFCELCYVCAMIRQGLTNREISSATNIHEFKINIYRKACSSIPPAKLRTILDRCSEADIALKSSVQTGYSAVERLICTF